MGGAKGGVLGEGLRALGVEEGRVVGVTFLVEPSCAIDSIEHVEVGERGVRVQVEVTVEHPRRGEVEVVLVSPSSTSTRLLGPRPEDASSRWGERRGRRSRGLIFGP